MFKKSSQPPLQGGVKYVLLITFILFPTFSFSQATTTSTSTPTINSTSTKEICIAINSIDVYSQINLFKIQTYLKNSFFPKILTTGRNDLQTRYYLKKFQYSFGLYQSGTLNSQTIKYLKQINSCFDLENRVNQIKNQVIIRYPSSQERITDLLSKMLEQYFPYPNTKTASSSFYSPTVQVTSVNPDITTYGITPPVNKQIPTPPVTDTSTSCTFENTPVGSYCGGKCHIVTGPVAYHTWYSTCLTGL